VGHSADVRHTRLGLPSWRGLALLAVTCTAFVGTWQSAPAGAAGILPPQNPPANVALTSSDYLTSIDSARTDEGVGPMNVTEATLATLPLPEQAFIVVNEERIDRGLPPIAYMTAQLNAYAQQGANAGNDPSIPTTLTGGGRLMWGGSVWAGGLSSVLEADFYWMYSDGFGGAQGSTTNSDCTSPSSAGCWGHRDIILHQFGSCGSAAATLSMGAAYSASGSPDGSIAVQLEGSCGAPPTDVTLTWSQVVASVFTSPYVIGIATLQNGKGYWEAESNGTVAGFGAAVDYGSMAGTSLNSPIVGIAATADGHGYWMVAADGGVFTFGDAPFLGSMGAVTLNRPVVGMSADPATGGYWLVAADGGIFSFGSPFYGSTGSIRLAQPIVGMEALPNGMGYRFEAADGGVFDFGQAVFAGSMGGQSLVAPVVGMGTDVANNGYWLVAGDGGIFSFGGVAYYGRITN
jgi:hypothetical protein